MKVGAIGSVMLLLATPSALAGGVNLTWGTGCWQDNPASLLTFACDTNVGSASLTASFAVDRSTYAFDLGGKLDLQSDTPQLPDWWQFASPPSCRAGSLSASFAFGEAPGGCRVLWPGQAQVTYFWVTAAYPGPYPPVSSQSRARFEVDIRPIPQGSPMTLLASTEYYAFTMTFDFTRTAGLGNCTGCGVPVTIVLNDLWIFPYHLTTPLENACLRWQADGVTPCSATPIRNRTWGALKSLYR